MADRIYTVEEKMIMSNVKSKSPHICYYCEKELAYANTSIDHKTPISRGGLTIEDNLVIACISCNQDKADMTEQEYYIYKQKQKEMMDTFEVNKAIDQLLEVQSNIMSRYTDIKSRFDEVDREIQYLQTELIYDNFNASEGYLYAKKFKELLQEKSELLILKDKYNKITVLVGSQQRQVKVVADKISSEVYDTSKIIIKRQVMNEKIKLKRKVGNLKLA